MIHPYAAVSAALALAGHFPTEQTGGGRALYGRTDDGIGYLLVATWTEDVDLDAVERALATLRDCKAMVVDARPNAGGSEDLARRIAAWSSTGPRCTRRTATVSAPVPGASARCSTAPSRATAMPTAA